MLRLLTVGVDKASLGPATSVLADTSSSDACPCPLGNLSFLRIFPGSDAQDGLDHVDGHRTVALAISPYIRRGSV